MIASIRGNLQQIEEGAIVVEVGGIGLRLSVPHSVLEALPGIGRSLTLQTKLVVREDALMLYGFASAEERDLFDLLLQVSGIGPRLALSAISSLSPDVLRSAVANDQPEVLTRIPGIGRKTAEKVIFQLNDRLTAPGITLDVPSGIDAEVLSVLTALGYSLVEAQAAVQTIPEETPEEIEARVKVALSYFASP